MKEIKFRALDKESKEYLDPKMFSVNGNGEIMFVWSFEIVQKYVDIQPNIIIMQYIGLKDKNGKEIYEGDVLLRIDTDKNKRFVVEWRSDVEFLGFIAVEKGEVEPFTKSFTPIEKDRLSTFSPWDKFAIIGNIYENPELLT